MFQLIDLPIPSDRELYLRTLERIVGELACHEFVDSVYQVGSMRHPGISDIDLLVIVDDTFRFDANPLDTLSAVERRLFTHSCFAVPRSLAGQLDEYALLHNYRRLHGTVWSWRSDRREVAGQTAKEFLVKNLIDAYVQTEYGIIKVRALLQHVKGLDLDLDVLRIADGALRDLVDNALDRIDNWFELRDVQTYMSDLAVRLVPLLRDAVHETTRETPLAAPAPAPVRVAQNMRVDDGPTVSLSHRGMRIPAFPGFEGRKQFNAHHRVNRFRIHLPVREAPSGSYERERFEFLCRLKAFVQDRYPAFAAPIPPLFYHQL